MSWEPDSEEIRLKQQADEIRKIREEQFGQSARRDKLTSDILEQRLRQEKRRE